MSFWVANEVGRDGVCSDAIYKGAIYNGFLAQSIWPRLLLDTIALFYSSGVPWFDPCQRLYLSYSDPVYFRPSKGAFQLVALDNRLVSKDTLVFIG